ncbi:MAG: TIGR04283 family arsenosugar biosynthesis glycosyltransferase [Rhodospirillales bacterium]|nr:TIGR04283 family arsenosugar biosynthesis glycosyltransferase [Rhodospirillales bacterium]
MLSIVVPTLNAARALPSAIEAVAGVAGEIVVADSGSTDGTVEVAERFGARMIQAPGSRGLQLRAGAEAARGDWLLFLHAETQLGPGWRAATRAFMATRAEAAGYFRLRLDDPHPAARRIERLSQWRSHHLGLPYGNQGLLMPRSLYESIGGFRPLPLLEDVDLARRLGKGRLAALEAEAITTTEAYHREGWWARPARNLVCLGLFFAGMPAEEIARLVVPQAGAGC